MKIQNILLEGSTTQEILAVLTAALLQVKESDVSDLSAFKKDVKVALDNKREQFVRTKIGDLAKNIMKRAHKNDRTIYRSGIDDVIPILDREDIWNLERALLNVEINHGD